MLKAELGTLLYKLHCFMQNYSKMCLCGPLSAIQTTILMVRLKSILKLPHNTDLFYFIYISKTPGGHSQVLAFNVLKRILNFMMP